MLIWYEALTGKQKLLFHFLAKKFEELGHQSIITSRPYGIDRANGNLDRLGRDHISIGEYGGASLYDKLVKGSGRVIELAKIIDEKHPDVLISLASPDAFRVAFGLGIPTIQVNDTPHAEAVARLTISLSDILVHPIAIRSSEFSQYGSTNFMSYNGVDEVLWIQEFKPDPKVLSELGVSSSEYIVVRCEESKSAYFQKLYPEVEPGSTIVVDLVKILQQNGLKLKIIAFPRYPEQERMLKLLDVIIPDESVDTLSLLYYAKAAMTAGGTMGREAALLGTPTIYSFPLELAVSTHIIDYGFPLHHVPDHMSVPNEMLKIINEDHMNEELRLQLLSEMETPFEGVLRALYSLNLS